MFCNRDSTCTDDDAACGGNIEGIRFVASRSHDFQYGEVMEQADAMLTHCLCTSRYFLDCLPFERECGQIAAHLDRACLAAHDFIHDLPGLGIAQIMVQTQFLDGFLDHSVTPIRKKFSSRVFPLGVKIDSG